MEVEYEWALHSSRSMTYQIVPIQVDPNDQVNWVAAYKSAVSADECGQYTSYEWVNRFIIVNPVQPSSIFIITAKSKTYIGSWQIEWPLTFKIF